MVRRRAKKRRTQRKTFGILSGLEAYAYASILSEGVLGTSPWGFITGQGDIGTTPTGNPSLEYMAGSGMQLVGADQISLSDIAMNPGLALGAMGSNFQQSAIPMALKSFGVAFTFRFARRLLRRPLSSVQRNIVKPLFGAGVSVR